MWETFPNYRSIFISAPLCSELGAHHHPSLPPLALYQLAVNPPPPLCSPSTKDIRV